LHWAFFHGSSSLELESRQLGFQYSFIHHLEHQEVVVSTNHGQTTTKSSLSCRLGKNSNHTILKMLTCLLKILPCWLFWTLNREKWLCIERETWI
jgi:hypothetical protein